MPVPVYQRPVDKIVTNVEADMVISLAKSIYKKAYFILNDGAVPIVCKLYGGPSGIDTDSLNPETSQNYTAAEVEREWIELDSSTIKAGEKLVLNIDNLTFVYYRIRAVTSPGYGTLESLLRIWLMGEDGANSR